MSLRVEHPSYVIASGTSLLCHCEPGETGRGNLEAWLYLLV